MVKPELTTFRVYPSVVPANRESEVKIVSQGGYMPFCDDITYEVQVIPTDISDIGDDESLTLFGLDSKRETYYIKPENGILRLKYFFADEQQWNIHISTNEYKEHGNSASSRCAAGVILSIYSLEPDLYNRRVLRGDLHMHTERSDGSETPLLTAAAYRRSGYDVVAITDHVLYDMGKYAREGMDFKSDFQILAAEEIQNGYNGQLHIVCIGADTSISDVLIHQKDRVQHEIKELKKKTIVPDNVPEKEYLYRLWVYNTAKNHGGVVIYPHPYWNLKKCRWQVGPNLALAILKNGLCDAFEIMGGGNAEENNLQTALYYEAVSQGAKLPIVGSTDNHSVLREHINASTYIFAVNNDIKSAILDGYTVAAEHLENEATRLYGSYRLVRYARFLTDNYFPIHNQLCMSSGQVMVDYVQGDKSTKELLEALEERILKFESEFFGRQ